MKLAFCLFKYFPYGGLQRDFLRIAQACHDRGHEVIVYTTHWEGDKTVFPVHRVPVNGLQNHARYRSYVKQLQAILPVHAPDLVVGFNKMPQLDVYFAADVCYQARAREKHGLLYRLTPRYRQWLAFEKAVFAKGKKTAILFISPAQQPLFTHYYQTELARFHLLPPGIAKDRMASAQAPLIRERRRAGWAPEDRLVLMVGSGFKTKGLDRAIRALAALPPSLQQRTHLWVVGQDNPVFFQRLAEKWQVAERVEFLGGRSDVPDLLVAADLLLHPAYHENTGTVLLEALVAGLPVLTTDVCGYAPYIEQANAGRVLSSPFQQTVLNHALETMLLSPELAIWQKNALAFARQADLYSMADKAADYIDSLLASRGA